MTPSGTGRSTSRAEGPHSCTGRQATETPPPVDEESRPTNMVHLLCDDALVEILVRLPSSSVLRCRAVCRRWRRITSDPSFLAAHAARRPLEMIVRPWFHHSEVRTVPLRFDDDEEEIRRFVPDEEVMVPYCRPPRGGRFLCDRSHRAADGTLLDWYNVVYSLDGLLVLRQSYDARYIIVNPTTRQSAALPELTPDPCFNVYPCGFYFHQLSSEYRLLFHCLEKELQGRATPWQDGERRFYVLSAASSRRLAGRAPAPTRALPRMTEYEVPVAHRGSLHWFTKHPEAAATGKMLAFDTVTETFRLMARPPERDDTSSSTMRALFELDDGKLGVVGLRGETSLEVWAMQDYEAAGRWALRHRVEVPPPVSLEPSGVLRMSRAINVGGGAVLLGDPGCGVPRLYDLNKKRMLRNVEICPDSPTFLVFSESLVPHEFFKSPPAPGWSEHTAPISFT